MHAQRFAPCLLLPACLHGDTDLSTSTGDGSTTDGTTDTSSDTSSSGDSTTKTSSDTSSSGDSTTTAPACGPAQHNECGVDLLSRTEPSSR